MAAIFFNSSRQLGGQNEICLENRRWNELNWGQQRPLDGNELEYEHRMASPSFSLRNGITELPSRSSPNMEELIADSGGRDFISVNYSRRMK